MGVQFAGNILVQSNGGPLPISQGGTGQTTATNAINALLPVQTGNAGKVLVTNGTNVSWSSSAGGSAGGADTQIQFNDSGSFNGMSAFTINKSTGALTATNTFTSAGLNVTAAAGNYRSLKLQTAGSDRWLVQANNTAESGSNTGSDFEIVSVADNGLTQNIVMSVSRSTQVANFLNAPTVGGSSLQSVVLPSQTGNNGKYLTTDGSTASWATVSASASSLTGTTLASNVVNSSLTSLGSLSSLTVTGSMLVGTNNSTFNVTTPATSVGGQVGGSITIQGGQQNNTSSPGGSVSLVGGAGANLNTTGGTVFLTGGTGITGGPIVMSTGATTVERFRITGSGEWQLAGSGGTSGQVLTSNGAGAAPTWTTVSSGAATSFATLTGSNTGTVNTITTAATTSPAATQLFITVGDNSAGTPGLLTIQGGTSTASSGTGAAVQLRGGTGGGAGSTTGGAIIIRGGLGTGSGGAIVFTTAPTTTDTERFRILANGAWSVGSAGTNTGTSGQFLTSAGSAAAPAWGSNIGVGWSDTRNAPTFSATPTIDCSVGNSYVVTMTANITSISFSNVPAAGKVFSLTMFLTQGGTGSYTVTWPASVKFAGGTAPTLTTTVGKTDIIGLVTHDGGTNWYGFVGGLNF